MDQDNCVFDEEEHKLRSVQFSDSNELNKDEMASDKSTHENLLLLPSDAPEIDEEKEEYVVSTTNHGEEEVLEGAAIGESDITDNQALSSDDDEDDGVVVHVSRSNITRKPMNKFTDRSQRSYVRPQIRDSKAESSDNAKTKVDEEIKALRFTHHRTAFDVDIDSLESHPWRKKNVNLSDYFNFGFDEESWRAYCERQLRVRSSKGLGPFNPSIVARGTPSQATAPIPAPVINTPTSHIMPPPPPRPEPTHFKSQPRPPPPPSRMAPALHAPIPPPAPGYMSYHHPPVMSGPPGSNFPPMMSPGPGMYPGPGPQGFFNPSQPGFPGPDPNINRNRPHDMMMMSASNASRLGHTRDDSREREKQSQDRRGELDRDFGRDRDLGPKIKKESNVDDGKDRSRGDRDRDNARDRDGGREKDRERDRDRDRDRGRDVVKRERSRSRDKRKR